MRIIITGGTGFLGKRLYCKLKENGHEIFCYDITDGYDILNIDQFEETILSFKPNSIVHLAACADLNIFAEKPEISYKINVIGTRNILTLCEKHKIRLLFASTCCVYGNNNIHPSDETSETSPNEPYAKSKKESENDILKIGLPHCCMRLATFYGPEMREALSPAIFIDRAHKNKEILVHGTGNQTRTFTYVDDIVSGIITLVENEPKFTIVNITSEEITSVNKIVKIVKEIVNNNVIVKNINDRKGQIFIEEIHSKRLQSFGWKWETNFTDGIKKSYEYYLKNNQKW